MDTSPNLLRTFSEPSLLGEWSKDPQVDVGDGNMVPVTDGVEAPVRVAPW